MNKTLKYFFFPLYILCFYSFSNSSWNLPGRHINSYLTSLKIMQTEDLGLGLQLCAKALAFSWEAVDTISLAPHPSHKRDLQILCYIRSLLCTTTCVSCHKLDYGSYIWDTCLDCVTISCSGMMSFTIETYFFRYYFSENLLSDSAYHQKYFL